MRKILIAFITLFCLTSCNPDYWYDDFRHDWYYDCGPSYLSHCISTNGEMFYVRTHSCPTVTYDMHTHLYYCWDKNYLILYSDRPITVHHTHNGYR